jgi:hypothetical protein
MSELDDSIRQVDAITPPSNGQRDHRHAPSAKPRGRLLFMILLLGFGVVIYQWGAIFGPTQSVVEADAIALLKTVDAALQAEQVKSGRLPEMLPQNVGSQWVNFQPTEDGYRLTTRINGVFQQLVRQGDRLSLERESK